VHFGVPKPTAARRSFGSFDCFLRTPSKEYCRRENIEKTAVGDVVIGRAREAPWHAAVAPVMLLLTLAMALALNMVMVIVQVMV
jgi:hypothetical protein